VRHIPRWAGHIPGHTSPTILHAARVAAYAVRVLGEAYHDALLCHDAGKRLVDAGLLYRDGPVSRLESIQIGEHAAWGRAVLQLIMDARCHGAPVPRVYQEMCALHHHWYDGSHPGSVAGANGAGVCDIPRAMVGDAIPYYVRVLSICDVYDAVLTRTYQVGHTRTPAEARAILAAGAGTQFDPHLVPIVIAALTNAHGDAFSPEEDAIAAYA